MKHDITTKPKLKSTTMAAAAVVIFSLGLGVGLKLDDMQGKSKNSEVSASEYIHAKALIEQFNDGLPTSAHNKRHRINYQKVIGDILEDDKVTWGEYEALVEVQKTIPLRGEIDRFWAADKSSPSRYK